MSQRASEFEKQALELLKEMTRWIRFGEKRQAKKIIKSLLDDEKKRVIYHLSDGKSSPQIAKIAKVHSSTVRDYWKQWAAEGIAKRHPRYKRRYIKELSFEELDFEIPEI